MPEQDPHAVLGVSPNATDTEIRNAYAARSKILHPDRFDRKKQPKEWAQANEMHGELNWAYMTLRQAIQRSGHGVQAADAEAANGQATSPTSTPGIPPAPHRPKRSFIDGRVILGLIAVGLWGLYSGATSLWRESGIDKVPHHLSLTELRDGTVPNNRLLRVSDAECDIGHGVAYLEHYNPRAYYIPLITPAGRAESKTSASGRRIILRLTKDLYDAHSGTLRSASAPLTVEGIRLPNTDIESRIEGCLKKELGIANLDNVVVIDGGRQPIGSLLPIKALIISAAWLLMLFFNFAKKPKLAWSAIAVLCGALAIVPDRLSLEPDYESPFVSQGTDSTGDYSQREMKSNASVQRGPGAPQAPASSANANGTPKGSNSDLQKFREAAEQGDAYAQFRLGLEFFTGLRVPQNFAEAAKWYRKAAETGNVDAQCALGSLYKDGDGVAKDSAEAIKWYSKAAEQADIDAARWLARIYFNGDGVPKSIAEAARWYRKAAERGNVDAQYELGYMYDVGTVMPSDPVDAAYQYENRYSTPSKHTERDSAEAAKWYRKAAEQGNADAQYKLGVLYYMIDGVPKDAREAIKWFRKTAEQGNAKAQCYLGNMYYIGYGVPKDEIEGLAWFYIAAASGGEWENERRTSAERRLGQQVSLLAQQRSKEILKNIQAAKANSTRITQSEQPEGAKRDATLTLTQSGTGVFVTADGLILTAAHVVKGVSSIQIQTSHGVKPGRLVKIDTKDDLALIRCEGTFQPAPVKAPRDVKLGQAVFTIGFPNIELQGVSPKMTRGEISSLAGLQDDPRQWQISVPVQPGNSGGPLFDEAGNVIGVIVAKLNAIKAAKFTGDLSQNVNYAVKSAPALQLLAPYSDKLARERQVNPSDKVETVVEQCRESVVLIFGYGP